MHASPKLLPAKRNNRKVSLLVAGMLLASAAPAIAGLNDPQPTLLFPGDGDERRSAAVPIVFARFDRPLRDTSNLVLRDATSATVPGIVRMNEPENEPESWRMIEFIPTHPLDESLSPYTASVNACGFPAGPCPVYSWTFVIDDTRPAVPAITSPAANALVTDQVVTVRGTAEPGALVLVYEEPELQRPLAIDQADSDGSYVVELPYPPEDGVSHTIRRQAVDRAGNVSLMSAPRTFVHDSVVFLPIVTWPTPGMFTSLPSVPVEGRGKAGSTVSILQNAAVVGSGPVGTDERFQVPIGFPNGTHTIVARTFDGLITDGPSPSVTFTVDTVAPAPPVVLTPPAGAAMPGPEVTVSGSAEPFGTVRVRQGPDLRAEVPVPANGGWSVTIPLTDGGHTLHAEALDRAGNVSSATSRSITVDSVVPVAPILTAPTSGAVLSSGTVSISGIAEAGSTVAIIANGSVLGTTVAGPSGAFSTALSFLDGGHAISARAVDAAGNVGPHSAERAFAVDTVAPPAPLIAQPFAGDSFARLPITVVGTAERGAGVTVYEGTNVLGATTASTEGAWSLEVSVPAGSPTIHATATDLAGNVSPAGPSVTFTYSPGSGDTTPPPAPVYSTPIQGSSVTQAVVFSGSAEPFSRVEVYEGTTLLVTANADENGKWATGRTLAAGTHSTLARAVDRAGNIGPPSFFRSFLVDVERPKVTLTSSQEIPETGPVPAIQIPQLFLPLVEASIAGTASDDNAVVRIELEATNRLTNERLGVFTAVCSSCPASTVSWTAPIAVPPGVYRYEVFAVDAAGQRSRGAILPVVTLRP